MLHTVAYKKVDWMGLRLALDDGMTVKQFCLQVISTLQGERSSYSSPSKRRKGKNHFAFFRWNSIFLCAFGSFFATAYSSATI